MEYFAIHVPKKTEEETETGIYEFSLNFMSQYCANAIKRNQDVVFIYRTIFVVRFCVCIYLFIKIKTTVRTSK